MNIIILESIIISLPVMIGLDKGRLQLSTLLFVIVIAPIGLPIVFGSLKGWVGMLLLFKVICWLVAFKLALNCKRLSDAK